MFVNNNPLAYLQNTLKIPLIVGTVANKSIHSPAIYPIRKPTMTISLEKQQKADIDPNH